MKRYFTFVELLTILAIIVVLGAILYPVWASNKLNRTTAENAVRVWAQRTIIDRDNSTEDKINCNTEQYGGRLPCTYTYINTHGDQSVIQLRCSNECFLY